MKIKFLKMTMIVFISLLVTACGFKLRGDMNLPSQLQTLYLQSNNPYGDFTKILRRTLKQAKVALVNSPQAADYTLNILSEKIDSATTTVSESTRIREDILTLVIRYSISNKTGKIIIEPQTISTQQSITVNTAQLLGSRNEQSQIEQSMWRDAARLLLDRLSAPQMVEQLGKLEKKT